WSPGGGRAGGTAALRGYAHERLHGDGPARVASPAGGVGADHADRGLHGPGSLGGTAVVLSGAVPGLDAGGLDGRRELSAAVGDAAACQTLRQRPRRWPAGGTEAHPRPRSHRWWAGDEDAVPASRPSGAS